MYVWISGTLLCTAAALSCSSDVLTAALPDDVSVNWANHVPPGANFTPPMGDVGFSVSPTGLAACCVLQAEVPQVDNSTYNFGMFLPDVWNGRFL